MRASPTRHPAPHHRSSPSSSPTLSGHGEDEQLLSISPQIAPTTTLQSAPPHPWSREDRKLRPIERILFWPIVICLCVPLAVARVVLLVWVAVASMLAIAICQGPLECLLEPAMKALGRVRAGI